jgi:hypothetical protein
MTNHHIHLPLVLVQGKNSYAVSVFATEKEHPFLVDQQYDYYPTSRISHNYVKIENDPININLYPSGTAPTGVVEPYTEASYRIGSLRDGYHRKVEHIGGTPRIEQVYDISGNLTTIPKFPPISAGANPDRYFLRTSDMGYVHYIKSSYHASNNEALETKNVTGKKTWIWDKTDMIRGGVVPGDVVGNESMQVKDVEVLEDAAIDAVDNSMPAWVAEDQAWEVFNIPGRTKIKSSAAQTEITMYGTDYSTVVGQFKMVLGPTIATVTITDGGRTITMNGTTVDVS